MDGENRSAWEKAIEVLEENTRIAMNKLMELKMGCDAILRAIQKLREDIKNGGPGTTPRPGEGPGTVKRLLILHIPDKTVAYFDDFKRPVGLRRCRKLIDLLRALTNKEVGDHAGADGLVPIKTQEQLINLIDEGMEKATLRAHVLRLRNELMAVGLDRRYVEMNKGRYRLRFAIDGQVVERYEDA
jgi:hypothetical protein